MSTTTVDSAAALTAALKAAHGGDTILLAPGAYSALTLTNLTFAQDVTISSADPNHQAVINNFTMNHVTGLSFNNVEMLSTGASSSSFGFNIYNSNDVHFDHVHVHGSLDGNSANDSSGINFINASNISVTNSTLEQLHQGVGISNGSNVTITGDTVHNVSATGLVFAQVDHVTVTGNAISSIEPTPGVHPDAIQFFTTGTTAASHDIVVSNNVIELGSGSATQGIFFRDVGGTLPYQNVHIDDNLVVGTGYGGVYIEGADGIELSGNELISNPGKTNNTFFLVQNSSNVAATNNQAELVSFDQVTGLTQSGNLLNQAVDDGGQAAMQAWAVSHPEALGLLTPFFAVEPVVVQAVTTAQAAIMPPVMQLAPMTMFNVDLFLS
jgi:parallel beta-helix repeat protein